MNWVRVKSRMLAAVAYNPDWHHLYLEFRSGDIFCYRGVPAERYEELLAAASAGNHGVPLYTAMPETKAASLIRHHTRRIKSRIGEGLVAT